MVVAVTVIATLQEQAVVLVIGNGGSVQSTLAANQGDQRGAGHSMMQGGGGGSNFSCQLSAAGATATTYSNSANDADVDGDNEDGGRQQHQQMQQQHRSPATKSTRFATRERQQHSVMISPYAGVIVALYECLVV